MLAIRDAGGPSGPIGARHADADPARRQQAVEQAVESGLHNQSQMAAMVASLPQPVVSFELVRQHILHSSAPRDLDILLHGASVVVAILRLHFVSARASENVARQEEQR